MNKYLHIFLLFLLIPILSYSQSEYQDSLKLELEKTTVDSIAFQLIDALCISHYGSDLKKAESYARQGLKLANEKKEVIWTAGFFSRLGSTLANQGQIEEAYDNFKESKSILESLNSEGKLEKRYKSRLALVYNQISFVHLENANYDKALDNLFQALKISEEVEDQTGTGYALTDIGNILTMQGKADEAIEYLKRAEVIQKAQQDWREVSLIKEFLSAAYLDKKEYSEALNLINEALGIYEENGVEQADLLGIFNTRGNIHKLSGNIESAEKDYLKCLELARQTGFLTFEYTAIGNLADVYFLKKDFEKSLEYNLIAIENNLKTGNYKNLPEAYTDAALNHEKLGNYKSAYDFMSKYKVIRDSIFDLEREEITAELTTKYETAQKEATIQIQKQEIQQAATIQKYTWGVLGLIGIIAGLLFWGFKNQKKNNKLLAIQNEQKEFLLKEIHHRVKNNLQVLSSLLNLQADYIKDETALDAVLEGRNRVQSMGFIHQKLYMGEHLAAVDMSEYLKDLSEHLLDSFGKKEQVGITRDVVVPNLDVDTAIPLGLILNELITNSMKYAFPNGRKGMIEIRLWINEQKQLCLKVADNGVGLAEAPQLKDSTSFGMDLVAILCQKLEGSIENEVEKGYSTLIKCSNFDLRVEKI